jgi:hypothetical protein
VRVDVLKGPMFPKSTWTCNLPSLLPIKEPDRGLERGVSAQWTQCLLIDSVDLQVAMGISGRRGRKAPPNLRITYGELFCRLKSPLKRLTARKGAILDCNPEEEE